MLVEVCCQDVVVELQDGPHQGIFCSQAQHFTTEQGTLGHHLTNSRGKHITCNTK